MSIDSCQWNYDNHQCWCWYPINIIIQHIDSRKKKGDTVVHQAIDYTGYEQNLSATWKWKNNKGLKKKDEMNRNKRWWWKALWKIARVDWKSTHQSSLPLTDFTVNRLDDIIITTSLQFYFQIYFFSSIYYFI